MTPEVTVLFIIVAVYVAAYGAVLPRMQVKTARSLRAADLKITAVMLVMVAGLYFGTNTSFTLVFFETWWWLYTLVVGFIVETPLAIWFCRKWGISWSDLGKL